MHPYHQYDRPSHSVENSVSLTCDPELPKIHKNYTKVTHFWQFWVTCQAHRIFHWVRWSIILMIWVHGTRLHHCFIGTTSHLHRLAGLRHSQNRPNLGILGIFGPYKERSWQVVANWGTIASVQPGHQRSNKQWIVGHDGAGSIQWLPVKFFFAMLSSFFFEPSVQCKHIFKLAWIKTLLAKRS